MFADVNLRFLAMIDDCDSDNGVHGGWMPAARRQSERERHSQGASISGRRSGWAESQGKLQVSRVGAEAAPQGLLNVLCRQCFLEPRSLNGLSFTGVCPAPRFPSHTHSILYLAWKNYRWFLGQAAWLVSVAWLGFDGSLKDRRVAHFSIRQEFY